MNPVWTAVIFSGADSSRSEPQSEEDTSTPEASRVVPLSGSIDSYDVISARAKLDMYE